MYIYVYIYNTYIYIYNIYIQPIPLGVTFSKAQSSKLERLFCHGSLKRDVRALSFETAFENVTPCGIGCIYICIYVCIKCTSPPLLIRDKDTSYAPYAPPPCKRKEKKVRIFVHIYLQIVHVQKRTYIYIHIICIYIYIYVYIYNVYIIYVYAYMH